MKKFVSVIIIIFFFLIFVIASGVGKIVGEEIISYFSSLNVAQAGNVLDKKFLSKIADTINKRMRLPKKIDEETILQSVSHAYSALIYNYILLKYSADELDKKESSTIMKQRVLSRGACKQFKKYIFNNELIVRYNYYGKNRNLICSFDITKNDCYN
jgi:hypothetical protein